MGYLSVHFSEEKRPTSTYPRLLCKYHIDRHFKDSYKTILDVGCGKGTHMREFQKLGYDVTGVDRLEEARELSPDLDIRIADLECDPLPFSDNTFDVAFSKSCIEHIHRPDYHVSEIYRILKPGGRLIIEVPDYAHHFNFYSDHTHVTPFVKGSLENILLIHEFKVIEVSSFVQIPFMWKMPWLSFLIYFFRCFPTPERPLKNYFTKWVWLSKSLGLIGVGEK
uniref:Putative methyltransferase n=1 Tax=viral metagenome TaxID=1070528 RepID=A0A6M3KBE1_9ZZZZ